MIRVLVVAASAVLRAGYEAMLTTNPKLTVVGSVANLDVLAATVEQQQLDVVLLDGNANNDASVWEKLLSLQQQYPVAIIAIANELNNIDLQTAINAGIRGILPFSSTESEILATTEAVASGLVVLHPDVIEYLLTTKESSLREKTLVNPVQALTPREIQVLEMLGSGMGNKAIASEMQISDHTVKFHVSSIFQKLGVSTRTEAVTVGVRLGLIML